MIHWKVRNNVVSEVFWKGKNVIFPWGFETSDSSSFFSQEKGVGWRYRLENEKSIWDKRRFELEDVVQMHDGRLKLSFADRIAGDSTICRSVTGECLTDFSILDFVLRFRFDKNYFDWVEIAGRRFKHRRTNLYREYPVKRVFLKWKNGKGGVLLKVTGFLAPSTMEPVMYVRDHEEEWVVHARMLPLNPERKVIKLCNRWCQTRPLPEILTKWILKHRGAEELLLRRSERKPFENLFLRALKPNAYGLAKIQSGEKLGWDVKVVFS